MPSSKIGLSNFSHLSATSVFFALWGLDSNFLRASVNCYPSPKAQKIQPPQLFLATPCNRSPLRNKNHFTVFCIKPFILTATTIKLTFFVISVFVPCCKQDLQTVFQTLFCKLAPSMWRGRQLIH